MEKQQKKPVGLRPRDVALAEGVTPWQRMHEILGAIAQYNVEGLSVPGDWGTELALLVEQQRDSAAHMIEVDSGYRDVARQKVQYLRDQGWQVEDVKLRHPDRPDEVMFVDKHGAARGGKRVW